MHQYAEQHQTRIRQALQASHELTHTARRLYLAAALAHGEDSDEKAQASTIHMHAKKTESQIMRYAGSHTEKPRNANVTTD